jgi:hypothetical protein
MDPFCKLYGFVEVIVFWDVVPSDLVEDYEHLRIYIHGLDNLKYGIGLINGLFHRSQSIN